VSIVDAQIWALVQGFHRPNGRPTCFMEGLTPYDVHPDLEAGDV